MLTAAYDDAAGVTAAFNKNLLTRINRELGGDFDVESFDHRAVWNAGLTGGCNYYRASPLRPPTGPDSPVMTIEFAPEFVTVRVPTLVIWAEEDAEFIIGDADLIVGQQRGAAHALTVDARSVGAAEIAQQ